MSTESRYQVMLNLQMSARYHQLCESLYLRVNDVALFLNLTLSSAAIGGAIGQVPQVALVANIAITLAAALSVTMGSTRKAQAHREQYRRFVELEARTEEMKDAALEAEIRRIERDDAPVIQAFRKRAYLDNLLRHGHEDEVKNSGVRLNLAEKLRVAFA